MVATVIEAEYETNWSRCCKIRPPTALHPRPRPISWQYGARTLAEHVGACAQVQGVSLQKASKPTTSSASPSPIPDAPSCPTTVERIVLVPEADIKRFECIGEKVSDSLDYRTGKLVIIRRRRPKYARPEADGSTMVLIADLLRCPIGKGIPDAYS